MKEIALAIAVMVVCNVPLAAITFRLVYGRPPKVAGETPHMRELAAWSDEIAGRSGGAP